MLGISSSSSCDENGDDTIKTERDPDYTISSSNILNPLEFNVSDDIFLHNADDDTRNVWTKMESSAKNEEIDQNNIFIVKEEILAEQQYLTENETKPYKQKGKIKQKKCIECGKIFDSKHKLHYHKKFKKCITNIVLFKCDICRKELKSKEKLEKHMIIHTKRFQCEFCQKMFKRKAHLIEHMTIHGSKSLKCDFCDKGFTTEAYLKKHRLSHTRQSHQCPICSVIFQHKESLDRHTIARHTSETVKSCMCTICGEVLVSLRKLKLHMIKHSDERPFECNLCESKFKIKALLTSHMRTHTGEKPFNCSECGRGFAKKSHLIDHQKTHSDDRPYECSICKERFKTKVTISHMTTHTGEKPFDCEFCEKSFAIYSKLKRHTRIHTGDKPYACTVCNLGYNKLPFLEKHLKFHDNRSLIFDGSSSTGGGHHPIESHEHYFKCSWCCGAFLTKRSLQFHQVKHSGGKSCVCTVCGQGFLTTDDLNEHIAVFHP